VPHGYVLLLHGWEGSHRSSYIQHSTAALLAEGFGVVQLNFRDHGDTHHLNPGLFHSCRLDEVVAAALWLQRRFPAPFWGAAGFSLGGNFALRLALAAPAAGLALGEVAAICPVLHGARGMAALESGLPLYHWYFMRKWRASLRRKAASFPGQFPLEAGLRLREMRELTRWLVEECTDFDSLDAYFDGYAIADDRLSQLAVPVAILTSADDPVIPVADFPALRLPPSATLEISPWGGHCGFLENAALDGFAERWVASRMAAARGSLQ
jgi:predicted alpha/beta-fold hydrolase